jgi:hypothetical protein
MSTVLNLFPARVPFVNADGTLTPEAYRALQTLMARVGGPLGDNGVDVFGELTGFGTYDSSSTDTVMQPTEKDALLDATMQPVIVDALMPDVVQPVFDRAMTAPESVTVSESPYSFKADRDGYLVVTGGTVTKKEYGRGAVFTDVGMLTSMLPIQLGDEIRVTYSALPTITFIPR